jgi:hypothetical protein
VLGRIRDVLAQSETVRDLARAALQGLVRP